jgi:hypothetical protein
MAVGESAGTVFVTIQGDATQLQALFAQTQGAAQAAGVRIATSFNAGAGSVSALETAIRELTTAVGQLNAALATNVSVTNAGAQAHRNFSSAAHGSVTEIQATSGALRVLEGSGGIRAAERFLTMIPGLGAALQMAFPVIGAIALIDATKKLIDNFSGLKEAEQGAEEAARAADSEFAHMVTTIDALNSKQQGAQFGGASAKFLNAQNLKSEAATATGALAGLQTQLAEYKKSTENIGNDFQAALTFGKSTQAEQANIQALTDKIAAAEQKVRVVVKQANDAYTDAVRDRAQEVGALSAKQVDGQIAGIKAEADAQREAAKAVIEQWKIAADSQAQSLTSAQARMVALSSNEVDAAERKADRLSAIAQDEAQREIEAINRKAAAQAQGKPETERREIFQGAANEVQGVQAGTLKTILDLHYALEAAILKEKETAVQAAREEEAEQKRFNEELEKTAEHWQKAGVEAVKAQTAHIEAQNKIGEKEGGPLSGTASTRLAGTPLGAALTLNQQGVKTVQILQDQIGRQQQLIDLATPATADLARDCAGADRQCRQDRRGQRGTSADAYPVEIDGDRKRRAGHRKCVRESACGTGRCSCVRCNRRRKTRSGYRQAGRRGAEGSRQATAGRGVHPGYRETHRYHRRPDGTTGSL